MSSVTWAWARGTVSRASINPSATSMNLIIAFSCTDLPRFALQRLPRQHAGIISPFPREQIGHLPHRAGNSGAKRPHRNDVDDEHDQDQSEHHSNGRKSRGIFRHKQSRHRRNDLQHRLAEPIEHRVSSRSLVICCGDLEQYFLWAISALAKRAVAALVPRWVLDRDRFDA